MAKKRVIIACGNGVATSTVVASKVKDYCAANGVSIEVTQCRMIELHDKADDYDLVVTTGKFSDPDIKTPLHHGHLPAHRHQRGAHAPEDRRCPPGLARQFGEKRVLLDALLAWQFERFHT